MKCLFVFLTLFFFVSSCVKNNPSPSWLEVKSWSLLSNPQSSFNTGELTQNFTDATVFIDEEIVGIFEVPFKIPILKSGSVNIKIYPTIKNNGISSTKKIYPFVKVFEVNAELVENGTLTLEPTTVYVDNAQFWIEDFEDASIKISTDPYSTAQLQSDNDPAVLKYGNFCGRISLNTDENQWLAMTNSQLMLPKGGKEVYLEIDYYNTNSMTSGLFSSMPTGGKGNVNVTMNRQEVATVHWKKIYIELKEVVSFYSTANYYELTFESILDAGLNESDVYLDNIKVVYL
jgi:hypothetical protein